MGYLHVDNLYKNQEILMFRECYAMEKCHGTSAHITWKQNPSNPDQRQLIFFSGGTSHELFVSLFDKDVLVKNLTEMCLPNDKDVTIYGESYGGKEQRMSETYGKSPKFVAFDVRIGNCWLSVPDAESFVKSLGLEFIYYKRIPTTLEAIDAERDADSELAIRNGMGPGKKREGIVLRPIIELTKNNGSRIICKHKRDEFRETKSPRPVVDPAKMKVLEDAEKVASEWVVPMRLQHVLQKMPDHCMEKMRDIIHAMVEDVLREGAGEIVDSEAVRKAIGKKTAVEYKNYLKSMIGKNEQIIFS